MKKIFYMLPAVIVCLFYVVMALMAGSIEEFHPVALFYAGFPVLAAVLLCAGKWWGCFCGIAVGAVFVYFGMAAKPQIFFAFVVGMILIAYYTTMGLICAASNQKE